MKKRVADKFWIPFWVDKWLWGSMRIECTIEERAIWIDLLALAAKDDGWIRANEDIPYPIEQLAGMLRIPKDKLSKAINKFVRLKKLTKSSNKTLYITEWEKYQFSNRHKRRVMSENGDMGSEKTDTITKNNIPNNNKENNNIEYPLEFESFWEHYPKKKEKKDAYFTWKTLSKKQQEEATIAAEHYKMETDALQTEEAYIKNPKTFLNKKKERWKDYLEPPKIQKRMTHQEKENEKIDKWAEEKKRKEKNGRQRNKRIL